MNAITLPRWLQSTATMQLRHVDIVVALALVLRLHGTAAAVRKAAMYMRTRIAMEHRPKMAYLARMPSDDRVLQVAHNIVQDGTDAWGILPGVPFMPNIQTAPRCHYKHMQLTGNPGARHWKCQCCSHTKPITWNAS